MFKIIWRTIIRNLHHEYGWSPNSEDMEPQGGTICPVSAIRYSNLQVKCKTKYKQKRDASFSLECLISKLKFAV